MRKRTISGKAVASLVLAVLSSGLWAFAWIAALVIGVAALVLAVLALWDIGNSEGPLKGHLLLVSGLVVQTGAMLVFLLLLPAVERVREAADRMTSG